MKELSFNYSPFSNFHSPLHYLQYSEIPELLHYRNMGAPIPATVQVLTRNSMPGIKRCLETLTHFAEVIVQDSYSTDGTREEAKKFSNVRLMDQNKAYLDSDGRITHFANMRNESIKAAKYDWLFVVDGDEEITQVMEDEVRSIVEQNVPGVYQAFRRFFVDGHPIMHCCCYPAVQIRLFHRGQVEGYEKAVHERLKLKPGVTMQMLNSELPIPLLPAEKLEAKYERYLRMEVKRLGVIPWGRWFKWVFIRNLKTIVGYTGRVILYRITPRTGKIMPWAYERQFIVHAWRTIWATCPTEAARSLTKDRTAVHTS